MTKTRNKRAKIKIPDNVQGRFVRVRYTDVGCQDGLCIEYDKERKRMVVYFGDGRLDNWVGTDQVVALGPRVEFPEF